MIRSYVGRVTEVGGCNFCTLRPEKILVIESDQATGFRLCRACYKELLRTLTYVIADAARGRNAAASRAIRPAVRAKNTASRPKRS